MMFKPIAIGSGVFLLGIALLIHVRFSRDDEGGGSTWKWPATPGRVIDSRIEIRLHRTQPADYADRILYEYTVKGRVYHSQAVDLQARDVRDRSAMYALVAAYPTGKAVTVWYDPANPSHALLVPQTGGANSDPRLLTARLIAAAGACLLALPWFLHA